MLFSPYGYWRNRSHHSDPGSGYMLISISSGGVAGIGSGWLDAKGCVLQLQACELDDTAGCISNTLLFHVANEFSL